VFMFNSSRSSVEAIWLCWWLQERAAMLHAIQIEPQTEEQGLATQHGQRAARRKSREFALHWDIDAFDQIRAPKELSRRRLLNLWTHSMGAMFAHLGFLKGPIFIARKVENSHQLWLPQLASVEKVAVARKDRLGDLQGDARNREKSDLGIRTRWFPSNQ
jgi:hypothetical protein